MTTELKLATVTLDNEIVAASRTQINSKNCTLKKEFLNFFTRAIHEPKRRKENDFVIGFLFIFQDMLRFCFPLQDLSKRCFFRLPSSRYAVTSWRGVNP